MELFNWFHKLTAKQWKFLAVNWLFFCYFQVIVTVFKVLVIDIPKKLLY